MQDHPSRSIARREWTKLLIVAAAVVLVAWDVYAAVYGVPGDTISHVIRSAANEHPVVPFLFGALMAHFFWPIKRH